MPSRLEIIFLRIARITLLLLAIFTVYIWVASVVGPSVGLILPINGAISSAYLISECVLLPIFIVSAVGYARFARRRTAAQKETRMAMAKDAAYSLPAVSNAFKSNSLISLTWIMDYKTNVQLNRKLFFSNPMIYMLSIFTGVGFDMIALPLRTIGPLFSLIVFIALFILGAVSYAILLMLRNERVLRKTQYFASDTLYVGMIVDPEGIRIILGTKEHSYPWTVVDNIRVIQGNMLFTREGAGVWIPSRAFQSTGDVNAFATTLQALKKGQTPPIYDWSAYVPQQVQTAEGVWPPPPTP